MYSGIYWTNGADEKGGWYDANKIDPDDGDADDNMCYAASAANLIAWWQNSEVGSTLSSEAPRKLGAIWEAFKDANQDIESGGEALSSINWWISGVYSPASREDADGWERYYVKSEDWGGDILDVTLKGFDGYYYDRYNLNQSKLSDLLVDMAMCGESFVKINFAELLTRGCCISLGIEYVDDDGEEAMGHAITLWGVEYNENGTLTTMWITDSDDMEEKLIKVAVTVDEKADKIWLSGGYNDNYQYYLDGVYVLDARESFKWSELSAKTYVTLKVNPETLNGYAGAALLTDAFMNEETGEEEEEAAPAPDEDMPEFVAVEEEAPEDEEEEEEEVAGALETIIDAMDAGEMDDHDAAAVAGASTAVLGLAFSGDVERQLRAIRNRSISGSYGQDAVVLDGKGGSMEQPDKYFAWVNAEGNRAEQNADGTAAGYTLSSWGGTVGAGMQVDSQLTLGLALTAMYGELRSDGPDSLDGDMDSAYLSAFARYQRGNWSHSFIGTVGAMEADYKRTAMNICNTGATEGTAFGLMYELSRDYALSNTSSISPVFNISYRRTEVDGYSERGTEAALNVGKQSLDTVTLGLGARYAALVGQQTFNRACAFEARALAKCDLGDTQADAGVGFIDHETRARIESAEMGAFGLELGAGISVPAGSGSIFADGTIELRSDYTNFNAAVGYRVQF